MTMARDPGEAAEASFRPAIDNDSACYRVDRSNRIARYRGLGETGVAYVARRALPGIYVYGRARLQEMFS